MGKYASEVVKLVQSWVGIEEGSEGHQMILDIYNSQSPLPRGYKMTINDAWCASAATALAVKLGYTDIIPCECSCSKMIEQAKAMGIWIEDESVTPKLGWFAVYDWADNGVGDCTGDPDHIGVVVEVVDGKLFVTEGNYDNSVKTRPVPLNGRYLRGYIAPNYDPEPESGDFTVPMRYLRLGCSGEDVRALQILLIGRGYSCGLYGANGVFGDAIRDAVIRFQTAAGLDADGIAGPDTMTALLGT